MAMMRYSSRQCDDKEKIERFLSEARIGFLGLANGHHPYVVPLNFVWHDGAIYFHGAEHGKKIEIMKENANACFTVCSEYGTLTDPVPAHTDTAYMSAMLFGKTEPVTDLDEATEAMQHMLDKYVPGYYNRPLAKQHVEKYRSSFGSAAAVYRLDPVDISAKENALDPAKAFYPGRRISDD